MEEHEIALEPAGDKKFKTKDILAKFLPYVEHDYTVVELVGE